jgi:protein-L-isoaspartate O-methyltransferase
MIIPLGDNLLAQELVLIKRISEAEFRRESLADVRFVPLVSGKE